MHRSAATGLWAVMAAVALSWFLMPPGVGPMMAVAQPTGGRVQNATVETAWSVERATPGDFRALAVVLTIRETLHTNALSVPAGSFLIPTKIELINAPAWLKVGQIQSPATHKIQVNYSGTPEMIEVHEGRVVFFVPVMVDVAAPVGDAMFSVRVRYQACDDKSCFAPTTVESPVTLHVVGVGQGTGATGGADFAAFDARVFAAMAGPAVTPPVSLPFFGYAIELDASSPLGFAGVLLLAMLGGFLLNLTPCVLPVIPIKIMGLSQSAGHRGRTLMLGVVMSLGVVLFWVGLAVAILMISGFDAISGLFKYHAFTVGIGVFIAVMAVGMCGLFSLRLPQWVYMINPRHDSVVGAMGFGVMTAVLSTPCTAPFMGGAAAWAVDQSKQNTLIPLVVFAMIGLGMALPYLVLSAFPKLVDRVPRTGPGSELVKQVMGLLMLAAAAYFIGVGLAGWRVVAPDPPTKIYWWAVMGLIAIAGGWMAWKSWRIARSPVRRVVFVTLGVLMLAASLMLAVRLVSPGPIDWVYYTPERFEKEIRAGRVVVVDFTADWCVNCKVLEGTVLNSTDVVAAIKQSDVVPMKVDLTGENEAGWAKLTEVGRVAIPALVIYGRDGKVVLNADSYTRSDVVKAIGNR